jgi:predicted dehydrogenase
MKLRGGLVGLGNIALKGHLPAYRSAAAEPGLEIVAACDVAAAAAEICGRELPGARLYATPEEMLAAEKLDFADVCSPPNTHAAAVGIFASAGVHVLCEKPLADRLEPALLIDGAVRSSPIVFVPCHQYRYSPLWGTVASVIAGGKIGRPTLAQFNVYRTQADTGSPAGNPAWRTDRSTSGGGILADTGAHYLYLAQMFFGVPVSVHADLKNLKHTGYPVEDTALVTLGYEHTAVQINLTWAADARGNSMVITGTGGNLRYDGTRLLLTRGGATEELPMPDISDKGQYVSWYASLLGEFSGRIRRKNHDHDLLEESLNVMKLLDLSYRSGGERRTLEFR